MQEKDTGDVPLETIMCIFVELERFVKSSDECVSMQDKWFVFEILFEQLRISEFDRSTMDVYLRQKMAVMDEIDRIKSATQLGEEKGMEKGMAERSIRIAREMKSNGLSSEMIVRCTGLSEEEIAGL